MVFLQIAPNRMLKSHRSAYFSSTIFRSPEHSLPQAKVAVSSVSIENAKANLKEDEKRHFSEARQKAVGFENALSDIVVETPVDSLKTMFYTALYHAQLAPVTFSDINGEFRKENDSIATAKTLRPIPRFLSGILLGQRTIIDTYRTGKSFRYYQLDA